MEYKGIKGTYDDILPKNYINIVSKMYKRDENPIKITRETFVEEIEELPDLTMENIPSLFQSGDEVMIVRVLRAFSSKFDKMDIEYSEDFYNFGFLYYLTNSFRSPNDEIKELSLDIICSMIQNKNYANDVLRIEKAFNVAPSEESMYPLNFLLENINDYPKDSKCGLFIVIYTLDILRCLCLRSNRFSDAFVDNCGIQCLYGLSQTCPFLEDVAKPIHSLLKVISSYDFDEEKVCDIFRLYAQIFKQTYKESIKSALSYVFDIASMDYFYEAFNEEGVIDLLIKTLIESSNEIYAEVACVCVSFCVRCPFKFLPIFPKLVKKMENNLDNQVIVWSLSLLFHKIYHYLVDYSPEEDADEEEETYEPIVDLTESIEEGDSAVFIGLLHESFIIRISNALMSVIADMDFIYKVTCIKFFFNILKNSSSNVCENIIANGAIPLLVKLLEVEDKEVQIDSINALRYIFLYEERERETHTLIDDFSSEDGIEIIEYMIECEDHDISEEANSLMEYINSIIED